MLRLAQSIIRAACLVRAHKRGRRVGELGPGRSIPSVFKVGAVVFYRTDLFEAYEAFRKALERTLT
jgi:hypothetical protein